MPKQKEKQKIIYKPKQPQQAADIQLGFTTGTSPDLPGKNNKTPKANEEQFDNRNMQQMGDIG